MVAAKRPILKIKGFFRYSGISKTRLKSGENGISAALKKQHAEPIELTAPVRNKSGM
jgi:hypothetical protein